MNSRNLLKFVDLTHKFNTYSSDLHLSLQRVIESGSFILGDAVRALEETIRLYSGAPSCISVANGTDALILSLLAAGVGPGDEVITTPMSYLATTSSIALVGATAVFVDIDESLNLNPAKISMAITENTKAISVVHLAGIPAQIEHIVEIAAQHNLKVIEDCAQSFGSLANGRMTGTFGDFGTLSFHPLKNLGSLGDGGLIMAKHSDQADWLKKARNHGHSDRDECDFWSINSRLDEMHASFLLTMLSDFDRELARRRRLAEIYVSELSDVVSFPAYSHCDSPSYNWIMVLAKRRDELMGYLLEAGFETKVHYPKLIPELKASRKNTRSADGLELARIRSREILSLPCNEHVTEEHAYTVCGLVKQFYS